MKIYTRTGDQGETSLYTGARVPKDSIYMHAVGDVDECNCAVGLALAHLPHDIEPVRSQLIRVQHLLFDAGAAIATPRTEADSKKIERTSFAPGSAEEMERWMDAMDADLPPLKTFILPGGHPAGAALHLARATCRRAERTLIQLHQRGDLAEELLKTINRLSDYFFMAARWVNHTLEIPETTWKHQ